MSFKPEKVLSKDFLTFMFPTTVSYLDFSELKNVGLNQYELWASGTVGTCDWAQILFSGGYKILVLVVILNIVVFRDDVGREVGGFLAYNYKKMYPKEIVRNN